MMAYQSTYNPNIPLRDLMYIAKEYEKYIKEKGVRSENARNTACPMHTKQFEESLHWN